MEKVTIVYKILKKLTKITNLKFIYFAFNNYSIMCLASTNESVKAKKYNYFRPLNSNITSYIAGYVAKMVEKQLVCIQCCKAIGSIECRHESTFLSFEDRGGLFKPSISVIKVCEMTEQNIVRMLSRLSGNLPRIKCSIVDAIAISVLEAINLALVF